MARLFKRTLSNFPALKYAVGKIAEINLAGRDFVFPNNLTGEDIKAILWTAMDLKYCKKQNCNINMQCVKGARISLLLDKPCTKNQFALQNASRNLDNNLNILINNTWQEDFLPNLDSYGKLLACYSDIIFCKNDCQYYIEKIAEGANVPVIAIKSCDFDIVKVLCDLMTLQLRYNHLKGLTLAWIGTHGGLLNTYMCLLPRLGINIRYYCADKSNACVSPELLHHGLRCSLHSNSEIHGCSSVREAVCRADVVATAHHSQEKLTITESTMAEAALDWGLLDTLPIGCEVTKELITHKNSLIWKSLRNAEWIYTALIIKFLKNYEPITQEPTFDDIEAGRKHI